MTVVSGRSQKQFVVVFSYEDIHRITKIDNWFIDKIAILVEMEQKLKTEELTAETIKRSKTLRVPG